MKKNINEVEIKYTTDRTKLIKQAIETNEECVSVGGLNTPDTSDDEDIGDDLMMLLPLKLEDKYKDKGYYYWIQTEEDYGEESYCIAHDELSDDDYEDINKVIEEELHFDNVAEEMFSIHTQPDIFYPDGDFNGPTTTQEAKALLEWIGLKEVPDPN